MLFDPTFTSFITKSAAVITLLACPYVLYFLFKRERVSDHWHDGTVGHKVWPLQHQVAMQKLIDSGFQFCDADPSDDFNVEGTYQQQ